ncbi:MAG TPA: ATP-dependent DNA ligase [Terriglobales bacterium]|nr:ATP-dependent DNA ligase [Terriglobales bacterium]
MTLRHDAASCIQFHMPRLARKTSFTPADRVTEGAVSPDELRGSFPSLGLPIPVPFAPMEAKSIEAIPTGADWQYEPKWDGFRCLAFRNGRQIALQSKAGQPLARYFPELVSALLELKPQRFVLDGEIVIARQGRLSFDDLLMRIHPAQSRIEKLSKQTPSTLLLFDLLMDSDGRVLLERPLRERRQRLEEFHASAGKGGVPGKPAVGLSGRRSARIKLSPATSSLAAARRWLTDEAGTGLDGVVAKPLSGPYLSGERAMRKVKRIRSVDCVVGGFRFASKGGEIGSLLLGLYDKNGLLHHVGFTSSFTREQRRGLMRVLQPYLGGTGFTGKAPGGPSRWSTERTGEWEALKPKLVVEVSYDHFSGGRFRHGTKFLRWRPEKTPESCTLDQLSAGGVQLDSIQKLFVA